MPLLDLPEEPALVSLELMIRLNPLRQGGELGSRELCKRAQIQSVEGKNCQIQSRAQRCKQGNEFCSGCCQQDIVENLQDSHATKFQVSRNVYPGTLEQLDQDSGNLEIGWK